MLGRVLLLVLLAAGAPGSPQDAAPAEPSTPLREELFVLELAQPADPAAGEQPPLAVGVAALRRSSDEHGEGIEWDLRFLDADTRVHHVESWRDGVPRLVWREWRPGAGRTLMAGLESKGGLSLVEWGREEGLRTRIEAPPDTLLPLRFLELARRGEWTEATVACFDPLSRTVERLEVELAPQGGSPGDPPAVPAERRVTTRRADGTHAGSYTFRGEELTEVRWQSGGLVARRIERADFDARIASAEPAVEASLVSR